MKLPRYLCKMVFYGPSTICQLLTLGPLCRQSRLKQQCNNVYVPRAETVWWYMDHIQQYYIPYNLIYYYFLKNLFNNSSYFNAAI